LRRQNQSSEKVGEGVEKSARGHRGAKKSLNWGEGRQEKEKKRLVGGEAMGRKTVYSGEVANKIKTKMPAQKQQKIQLTRKGYPWRENQVQRGGKFFIIQFLQKGKK